MFWWVTVPMPMLRIPHRRRRGRAAARDRGRGTASCPPRPSRAASRNTGTARERARARRSRPRRGVDAGSTPRRRAHDGRWRRRAPLASTSNVPRAVAPHVSCRASLEGGRADSRPALVVGEHAVERGAKLGRVVARKPVSPSSTASSCPAMRVATAGVPHAAASVIVMPQPSWADALATTHARRYSASNSSSDEPAREASIQSSRTQLVAQRLQSLAS